MDGTENILGRIINNISTKGGENWNVAQSAEAVEYTDCTSAEG